MIKKIATLTLITVMILSIAENTYAQSLNNSSGYKDYSFSLLEIKSRITYSKLYDQTKGLMNVESFENFIQSNILTYNIRRVLLDIGWQDYPFGKVEYQKWVDDWMTACDMLGLQVVIFAGQLTTKGVNSTWVRSVIANESLARTYYSNGTSAQYIAYDNPDVKNFFILDLKRLYSFYGSHLSWVGIGTGSDSRDPYFSNFSLPTMGYSNESLINYVNSFFYSREVNSTGYLRGGIIDPLWSEFKNMSHPIVLSSGVWMTSSPVKVSGKNYGSNYVDMLFNISTTLSSMSVLWYGSITGKPGPLRVEIFQDSNGVIHKGNIVANFSIGQELFSSSTGWQEFTLVGLSLKNGSYWMRFSSSGDTENYYTIYVRDYPLIYQYAFIHSYSDNSTIKGSSVLWIKDISGKTLYLAPYQQVVVSPQPIQNFFASKSFEFNTVFLFLSDRVYDDTNGTLYIIDRTSNKVVADGILSQKETHGLQNWTPVLLNTTVHALKGHLYSIEVADPGSTYSWRVVLRGEYTDPQILGFQGQSSYLLFMLANIKLVSKFFDFTGVRSNGMDAVSSSYMDAVRFLPSSKENLNEVDIMMSGNGIGNYSSGYFIASLFNGTPDGSRPLNMIQQVRVKANSVPVNGLLKLKGFNSSLDAGKYYWIVFSANSSQTFGLLRLTSSYAFKVLTSSDGGKTWTEPKEGPTDFSFSIILSREVLGNNVSGQMMLPLGKEDIYAQVFQVSTQTVVGGLFIGPLKPGGLIQVSISRDNGNGEPSLYFLTKINYRSSSITLPYGLQFIAFETPAYLSPGRYWITLKPIDMQYNIFPIIFTKNVEGKSLVSSDGGLSWHRFSNDTALLLYGVASIPNAKMMANTSINSGYILKYHIRNDSKYLTGWNGYIRYSELSLYSDIAKWVSSNSGNSFYFFTDIPQIYLSQLSISNVISLSSSKPETCTGLRQQLLTGILNSNNQFVEISNEKLLEPCYYSFLPSLINKLEPSISGSYFSGYSGKKVLVVGEYPSLIPLLLSSYNVSFIPSINLEQANLSSFKAILLALSQSQLNSKEVNYIFSGGNIIVVSNSDNFSSLIPLQYKKLFSEPSKEFLDSLSLQGIDLSWENNTYFSSLSLKKAKFYLSMAGNGTLCYIATANMMGEVSKESLVLMNTLSLITNSGRPFWFSIDDTQGINFALKKTSDDYLLIQLINNQTHKETINLKVNLSYYGISNKWLTVNTSSLITKKGAGNILSLNVSLGGLDIQNLYVVNQKVDKIILYSNVLIQRQLIYPNQAIYSIKSTSHQKIFLILNSSLPIDSIDGENISGIQELRENNNISVLQFISSGSLNLRISFVNQKSIIPDTYNKILFFAVFFAVVTDSVVFVFYMKRKRGRFDG
jgi:hypothetical protein